MRFAATLVLLLSACSGFSTGTQSDVCRDYFRCMDVTGVSAKSTPDPAYFEGGSCWASPAAAQTCSSACTRGLTDLRTQFPDSGC